MSLIEVSHLSKFFDSESGRVVALNDVSFNVDEGEFVGIVGKSGSGKTTLINMLTGIDHPSEGSIVINGNHLEKIAKMSRRYGAAKILHRLSVFQLK